MENEDELKLLFHSIEEHIDQGTEVPLDSILLNYEVISLTESLARSRGENGFTPEELDLVLEWARFTRINEATLNLVVRGLAEVDWREGEVFLGISKEGAEALRDWETEHGTN